MPTARPVVGGSAGRSAALALALALGACASVPPVQLAYGAGADGALAARPLPCDARAPTAAVLPAAALPGAELRVLSWNLHKNADPGWDAALSGYAARSDLLLVQEAALTPELRALLAASGHAHWTLAGSWGLGGVETGVLSAARVAPLAECVQRAFEPLLQLPKAALISHFALEGSDAPLAVANLHAVNFTLGMQEFRAQLDALVQVLELHSGPMIVAGDFNTWSAQRLQAMHEAMARLTLAAVTPAADRRTRVFGQQIDHLFVRGLELRAAEVPEVDASDHNPLLATLRLAATAASR